MADRKLISLSKHIGISREELEEKDVFDSTLGIDTKLFIDSKLLTSSLIPEFSQSRESILLYFNRLIGILKQSANIPRLQIKARDMLSVPEPAGLSIGYGQKNDDGLAIPKDVASAMLVSATEMLNVGVEDSEIMELLGLFVGGFGPDRMSDLTAHIIYSDLCSFTERVSIELKVLNLVEFEINGKKYNLPKHPFSNHQIIFVPSSLLRKLPLVSSWDEVSEAASFNEEVRNEYNEIVFSVLKGATEKITKQNSKDLKKSKENLTKLLEVYRKLTVTPYNLAEDSVGCYNIQPFIEKNNLQINPSSKPKNSIELVISIRELLNQFKRQIVNLGGNKLLYRRTKTGKLKIWEPHREDVAQTLFYCTADLFCQRADIMLAGESDAGRGPVDFSLGTGYENKVLVEIKKSNNPNLLSGFSKQITTYAESENAVHSFYLVIIVKTEDPLKGKHQLAKLEALFRKRIDSGLVTPELYIIDGLVYPSASKLK